MNLKELAKDTLTTLDYWFRSKYNLSPKDSRYLDCEPWELALEFELEQTKNEYVRSPLGNTCPECGKFFLGNECSDCGHKMKSEKYFDPDFDEYFDEVLEENEKFFSTPIKWEEIKDDDIGGIGKG